MDAEYVMRLAAGTDPAQTGGQAQLLSLTMGRSSQIHAIELHHHSDTTHFTKLCTFTPDLVHGVHVAAFALSPPKKKKASTFSEMIVVI